MKLFGKANLKKCSAAILTALIFALFSAFPAFARTVAEYQKSVDAAKILVAEMIGHLYDVREGVSAPDKEFERAHIAKIRQTLPDTEKIEWQGAVVETQNKWIKDKLDDFSNQSADSPEREKILVEISERLESVSAKLKEIRTAADSGRSKDEEKRKISEILKREEYQKPEKKEKSLFEQWYEAIMEWLSSWFPRPNIPNSAPDASGLKPVSVVLQILLYAVILGIIAFLIYKFSPFFIAKFKKREKREKKERVILGEKIAANESSMTIFDEAERLAREGNLRDAIRKGYIALLCELNDRKIIGLARHKTNRDYLRDVRAKREIYDNMSGLTNSFEKHWYGTETAGEEDWSEFRQKYQKTVSIKQ